MPRHIVYVASALAWLTVMPLALSWAASKGKLYDDGKFIGEIIEVGPELGHGGYSHVYEVTFRDPQGHERKKALKEFLPSTRSSTIQEARENWELLEPIRSEDPHGFLSYGHAGLKLIPNGTHGAQSMSQVVLIELANGSTHSIAPSLKLNPRHPYFGAKIELALKYKRDILSAITLLSSHGLAHGDIKPENVLYKTQPGFDFEKPDVSKIHFSLSDFDALARVGDFQNVHTEDYAAPELILEKIERASAPRDLFSHAVAVHTLIFGDHPFEKKFKSLRGSAATPAQFSAELFNIFENPRLYEEYLKSVDERFKDLEDSAKTESSRQHLKELHDFVLKALKLDSHERLAAFPEIKNGLQRFLQAQRNCGGAILNRLASHLY